MMTEDELDRLEALASAATPGPWESTWNQVDVDGETEDVITTSEPREQYRSVVGTFWYDGLHAGCKEQDAAFIAACREAVPKLIAEVRRIRKELDEWLAEVDLTEGEP